MVSDTERQNVKQLISSTLELSNDIYRNAQDANFANRGGQLIYCFDATVFNLFYDTIGWRHAVASFHSRGMGPKSHADQRKAIEAQSALIAAEHLLSEDLPGASSRSIYLSPWHADELARQLDSALEELKTRKDKDRERIHSELQLKLAVMKLYHSELGRSESEGLYDEALKHDLLALGQTISDPSSMERYEITRVAASVLAKCDLTERLDQIHRIVSTPIVDRIKSITEEFLPSELEHEALAVDARTWYWRIVAETRQPSRTGKSLRTKGGMWNDARTLALLSWISRARVRDDQKIVFITSDGLLFDAYRRWWVNQGGESGSRDESFLFRRSFQYTPIFNFTDSENDLRKTASVMDNVRDLFYKIQEAVEVSLMPFNLSNLDGLPLDGLSPTILKGREHLALLALEETSSDSRGIVDFFMRRLDDTWFTRQRRALTEISNLWLHIERLGIGFFYDHVTKRLDSDKYLFKVGYNEVVNHHAGDEIIHFFSQSLDNLATRTRSTWMPAVSSFLEEQRADNSLYASKRAPETLWYRLPSGRGVYDAIASWNPANAKRQSLDLDDFDKAPEAVFVFASVLALRKQEWWRAEEFAAYSLNASSTRVREDDTYWELQFLQAFTKRFRMGGIGPHCDQTSLDKGLSIPVEASFQRAKTLFEDAASILDRCVQFHYLRKDREVDRLRYIRALSERAALYLFFAISSLAKNEFVLSTSLALSLSDLAPVSLKLVNCAQEDIISCLSSGASLTGDLTRAQSQKLRQQYLHNAAASEVIRFMSAPSSEFRVRNEFLSVAKLVESEFSSDIYQSNPGLSIDQYVFRFLCGDADPAMWSGFETALAEGARSKFALDRAAAVLLFKLKGDISRFISFS